MSEVRFYDGRPVFCDSTILESRGRDKGKLVTRFYHIKPNMSLVCIGKAVWSDRPGFVIGYMTMNGGETYNNAKYEDLGPMTYGRAVQIFVTACEEMVHEEGPQ